MRWVSHPERASPDLRGASRTRSRPRYLGVLSTDGGAADLTDVNVLINGRDVAASNGAPFERRGSISGEVASRAAAAGAVDARAAADAAAAAFPAWSRDVTRALDVAHRIESGIYHVNGLTVRDEAQMPFRGVKASG